MKLREKINPTIVYTIISLFGIILLLFYWGLKKKFPLGEFILNLSTEIIGVSLIFFILYIYVENREEQIYKKLSQLRQKLFPNELILESSKDVFEQIAFLESKVVGLMIKPDTYETRKEDEALKLFDINENLENTKELFLVGENMFGVLSQIEAKLPELIDKGLIVKILTINNDENDPITKLITNSQRQFARLEKDIISGTKDTFLFLENIVNKLRLYYPNHRGEIIHKILNGVPPCSIIIIKGPKGSFEKAKIVFYRPSQYKKDRIPKPKFRIIVDKSLHYDYFNFYEEQFDILWEHNSIQTPNELTSKTKMTK